MARKLRRNQRFDQGRLDTAQYDPTIYAKPIQPLQLKGHDKSSALSRLPEGVARLVRDLCVRDGEYVTRDGTQALGDAADAAIVHSQEIVLASGSIYNCRFKTNGVQVLQGGVWQAASGAGWNTTDLRNFSITGWGDSVVFAEDTLGIFRLDFTGAYAVTRIKALGGVKHLATFAGRIIASVDDQIVWSIKNDETDWDGLGSGFEDLRSAFGGRPDGQTAVVPISDDTALCIRTNSVWLMTETGDFDAPFRFTRLADGNGKGCKWPRTVAGTAGGAIWVGDDGAIWMYEDNKVVDISHAIYHSLDTTPGLLRRASASYDLRYGEYRLTIPDGSATSIVSRFNRSLGLWTEDSYQFPIRSVSFALYGQQITIDELVGTIDSLVGTVDDLGGTKPIVKAMFTMADPYRLTVLEKRVIVAGSRDINQAGNPANGSLRIETGYVRAGDVLHRTETFQIVTEYECDFACTLQYYYSDDGGITWNLLTSPAIGVTTKPTQLALDYTLDRDNIQFAVVSADVAKLKLIDFFVTARQGGMIIDAH
jgi:hypothetical protein